MTGTAAARTWTRFTPAQRLARFAVQLGIVLAVVASLRSIEIIPEFISDAPEQMRDLLVRMWPPAWGFYGRGVHDALVETLHIATQGTILAILMAVPLGLLAARNITRSAPLNFVARLVLVSSRSINSLVWALLFVGIFGPGPLAGTFATAFRSVGFVGKLLGEALEETPRGSIEALEATGARRGGLLLYGYWPAVKPSFWSIALFRWDINVRESSVLGLVGAGGIGMALESAMNLFQWERVAVMLIAIFVVVILAEMAVTALRKRML